MRIQDISSNLQPDADGIYVTPGSTAKVSYASHGHAECFGVEDASFWFRHRSECISAMVKCHPHPGGTFLDLGGGNGYVAQRLEADGHDVLLVEPGPEGARNARMRRHLPHVACARMEDCQFKDGSFGAIGMFDVIEHIQDDRGFLVGIAPLLAHGGKLYLSVPCHDWLWSQADVTAGHFRRHTTASMVSLLDGLFRIDYLSFIFLPLVLPQLLLRALPYRLGLGRDGLLPPEVEHGKRGNGMAIDLLDRILAIETRRIRRGGRIPFGASCLVSASAA
ncbi:class I SAM-dependent methyltransferase [Pseudoxanthomonas sp. 10H]|uniref:class I SAM-dependent methyltransferase n=1 Tax=Pseudoxanthomonas sp. 10H TaxID=3242729 RepID=UPI0035568302